MTSRWSMRLETSTGTSTSTRRTRRFHAFASFTSRSINLDPSRGFRARIGVRPDSQMFGPSGRRRQNPLIARDSARCCSSTFGGNGGGSDRHGRGPRFKSVYAHHRNPLLLQGIRCCRAHRQMTRALLSRANSREFWSTCRLPAPVRGHTGLPGPVRGRHGGHRTLRPRRAPQQHRSSP